MDNKENVNDLKEKIRTQKDIALFFFSAALTMFVINFFLIVALVVTLLGS